MNWKWKGELILWNIEQQKKKDLRYLIDLSICLVQF